jgi:ribosomal protein S12 methylthiotransferase accessory factor
VLVGRHDRAAAAVVRVERIVNRVILAEVECTPLERSLPMLKSLISPLTGIVPFTTPMLPSTDDARLFHVASTTANAESLIGAATNRYSGGIDYTPAGALAAAIGEAAERYAGAYIPASHMVVATAAELGDSAVDPASFALFDDAQYAQPNFHFRRFTEHTRVRWSPAFRLPGGERAYVPTQLVHLLADSHDDTPVGYATSSGMACGATLEEAILSGLLELVERDAFLLTWYNRLSLPRIDWSGDPALVRLDDEFFRPTGLRYAAIDLSAFLRVPTALGIVLDENGGPAFAAGAASSVTMDVAVRKALREAFQTRAFARQLRADLPDWSCDDPRAVTTFEDHVLYHAYPSRAGIDDFLLASPLRVRVGDVAPVEGRNVTANIRAIVARLASAGVDTYVVDTAPEDLRAAGLHAVTVVCPQLCRLDVPHDLRYFGAARLYDAAFGAGVTDRPFTRDDLNPEPHPFP